MKKRLCMLIVLSLILSLLPHVSAAAEGGDTEALSEWATDIRLSICDERDLRQEAGMDLAAWDRAVEEMKQAGLAAPISAEDILRADENARILEEDGLVYQIGPSGLFGPVRNAPEAYRLAYRLVETLGGSSLTVLILKSKLTMLDTTVYSFQQILDGEEVLGGTLKIALDGSGEVTALFSSIDPEASREQTLLTREEAEALAAARCEENGLAAEPLKEYTDRVFAFPHPFAEVLDLNIDDQVLPEELMWVVYTRNEAAGGPDQEYPFLAHYIRIDGAYLSSLPVRQPGDAEARSGFRQQELFAGMRADSYTGEITDVYGNTRTVTLPVMRSDADDCWYLGDVDRRIVFADFYEAAYGENHELVLLRSGDKRDWDNEDLYTYYNYLQVRDLYAAMGWNGPDGKGSDELILKGMCFRDGTLFVNACSLGKLECWQVFGYTPYSESGEPTGLTRALDVMAHEYTHTFTTTVMNQNLYENDMGAINEAMSDIIGNLFELICEDTDDTTWLLGENSGAPIRSMSDPALFGQPTSVWGLYYAPKTDEPSTVNDYGGVHLNSSLLNLIAERLCTEYGMRYEDALSFWLMAAMGLTPRTDYLRMSALLVWAMEQSGNSGSYGDALAELIGRTRIDRTDPPETLPEGQKLVRLVLPDTEAFRDENWALVIVQREAKSREELSDDIHDFFTQLLTDPERRAAFSEQMGHFLELLALLDQEPDASADADGEDGGEAPDALSEILSELDLRTKSLLYKGEVTLVTYEDMDSGVMPVILEDKPSLYSLMNVSERGSQVNKTLALIDGTWVDITDSADDLTVIRDVLGVDNMWLKTGLESMAKTSAAASPDGTDAGAENLPIEYLPVTGLESVELSA